MKRAFIAIVICIAVISLMVWLGVLFNSSQESYKAERFTYTGVVTAIVHGQSFDKVWLNSNPKVIEINGTIELATGKTYEITINGHGELINARILD